MHHQGTFAAFGISGGAAVSAEEDDAVAEIITFLGGQNFTKLLFHLFRFFTLAQTQPSADADAVGVADHASGNGIKITQQEIGGFSANAGNPQRSSMVPGTFPL